MIMTDVVLVAALVIFLLAWWVRATPFRPRVLLVAALVALAAGVAGILDDRWQDGFGVVAALAALLVLLVNRLRRTDRRDGVPWLSGVLFVVLVALAILPIALFPVAPLPKPGGPYPVGVRTFEAADASRPGVFAAEPGEPRRLLVRVWYPAGSVAGLKPAPYFSDLEARTTARSVGAMFGFPPFITFQKHVRTNSYAGAPLLPGAKGLPVVFYSHGYTSYLSQNTALMEHLASHGYVVFSVQHTYDSAATAFPDGTVAGVDPELARISEAAAKEGPPKAQAEALAGRTLDARFEGWLAHREAAQKEQARLLKSGVVWTQDRIFVHDRLQSGDVPADIRPIAAAGDLARVGQMGMSFGGATSGTVCVIDRRCGAGINLDGGDFPFQAFATQVPVPFLMFHSDLDNLYGALGVKGEAPLRSFNEFSYEALGGTGPRPPVYRVMLKDTEHLGLSDSSLFMRRPVRDPILGKAPAKVMVGAQNDFVLAFFERHLRGQDVPFPGPQLATYKDWAVAVPDGGVQAWWAGKTAAERAVLEARIARARPATP